MKILYVEDDPRDADITARILRKTPHFQLESVRTMKDAIERIASESFDLLLTDVHLPDGDGLSLLKYVREHSFPLAVVVITGMGDEETAVEAFKAQADDYVVKGKDYLDRLLVTLESALNHHRADAARRTHPLRVLYVENDLHVIESTRSHFAVHADHLHLEIAFTAPEAVIALQRDDSNPPYEVLLMDLQVP